MKSQNSNDFIKARQAIATAHKFPMSQPPLAGMSSEMRKAYVVTPGQGNASLVYYDLQHGALSLYPDTTPLRNAIPRISAGLGAQANWKAITGININNIAVGVSEGGRSGLISTTTQDYSAVYRALGLEDYVTFEADYAASGFDDVKSLAVQGLMRSLMIGEEKMILGGNNSLALGTTPTPVLTASASGGSLAAGTVSVIAVALTLDGYLSASLSNGVRGQVSRSNADGSTDSFGSGAAQKSANATVTVSGSTASVSATVSPVRGAVAYAWFWGAAGAETLGAITTINSMVIAAAATGSQLASALASSDASTNGLAFDGLLTQVFKTGGNAYFNALPTGTAGTGTPLTADGLGGVVEIDTALKAFWDNYRLSPDTIWVNSQEMMNITRKVMGGGLNPRIIINSDNGNLSGGEVVTSYLNKFNMDGAKTVAIRLHPNLPPGTILFTTQELPYPLSGVGTVLQMRMRRDYYQIEWPLKTRRYEFGVYMDGVLQNYFPPAFGVITNIANG